MSTRTEARLREGVERVREGVAAALERSGRSRSDGVRILVATKYFEQDKISVLEDAGIDLLGENTAQDLVRKQEIFGDRFEWHFIGHLQRRKAKVVVPRVGLIHSVDSVRLVHELSRRAPEDGAVEVLFQVNVSGEDTKYGVPEGGLGALLEAAAETGGRVRPRGFMTLAPLVEDPEKVRPVFAKLRVIRDRLRQIWSPHFDLTELSMGMSGDYEVAVEEGATLIRIGRALIGEDSP